MTQKSETRDEGARLQALFVEAGAQLVDADVLQPAETLLDLYGEDIRARAYVTNDPLRGEQMLRPDFTVPVVQMHMKSGATPARYAYSGEVFRRQEEDIDRANEYFQTGFEVFDGADPAAADAEVFALFQQVLAPLNLRAATGDIGILKAAVQGLGTSERRRAALLRHIWRPHRFRTLLDRFSGRKATAATRDRMLETLAVSSAAQMIENAGKFIGKRSVSEISERLAVLEADAREPAISAAETEVLDQILRLRETAPNVVEALRDIAIDLPSIGDAVTQLARRLDAMSARGVDVDNLEFEASYGRSTMEYYDGFVFGFYAPTRPDLPPVATGGRYDALTRVLGHGVSIPAVGGVIRPGLTRALKEGEL
jgi:ATP phosphoribosyltransferase regulatory subunit